MTDKEVMQMALDALEKHIYEYEAVQALRAALAQPETYPENFIDALRFEAALAQPKKEWVSLTGEEIEQAAQGGDTNFWDFCDIIEDILKEKNT